MNTWIIQQGYLLALRYKLQKSQSFFLSFTVAFSSFSSRTLGGVQRYPVIKFELTKGIQGHLRTAEKRGWKNEGSEFVYLYAGSVISVLQNSGPSVKLATHDHTESQSIQIFTSYSLMYHSIHFKMTKNNLHTTQTLHGITYYESPTQVYRFGNSSSVLSNQKTWRLRNLTWEKLRLVGSFSPSVCDSIAYKIYLHKTHLPAMKYRDMPTHWHISSTKKWSHVSLVV